MPAPSLVVRDVRKSYPDRLVLDGLDLVATPGQRVGLIGENGSGKSTLVRLVAGLEQPDSGSIAAPDDLGYLAQDSGLRDDATVEEVLTEALAPLHEAVADLERLAGELPGSADAYAQRLEWVEAHDAWDADRRAEVAAHRLGLGALERDKPVRELSGGQRARLALAALLTRRPACLVLDEPTNHLDAEALDFLEAQLISMPGVVLVASHDRMLLERVCTTLVDLDPAHLGTDGRGGRAYSGAYSTYLSAKRDSRRRWEEAFEQQQETLNALRVRTRTTTLDIAHDRPPRDNDKYIYSFKGENVQAQVRRRVRDAEQRIAAIERDLVPKPPVPVDFSGSFDGRRAASVRLRDLSVPGRLHLARLDVAAGEHLLVTGANGTGKSTLLSVLAGRLEAAGDVQVDARSVGFLPQEVRFADPTRTPREIYADVDPLRPITDLGLLHPRDLTRPVGVLSEGQRRRLALALLMATPHDLLLLDEPSNHLSPSLVDAVEEAVRRTPVTVLVASHDRWLRSRWQGSVCLVRPPRRGAAARPGS